MLGDKGRIEAERLSLLGELRCGNRDLQVYRASQRDAVGESDPLGQLVLPTDSCRLSTLPTSLRGICSMILNSTGIL
jgi:hypothetical protein